MACATGFPTSSFFAWSTAARAVYKGSVVKRQGPPPPLYQHGWSECGAVTVAGREFAIQFPSHPIWSGIVINAMTHAAAWCGLFAGVAWVMPAARRARRMKRGACPECAYDLRGDFAAGCLECGWKRAR